MAYNPLMSYVGMWAGTEGERVTFSQDLFERVYLALHDDNTTHRMSVAQELLDAAPPHWSDPADASGTHGGTVANRDRRGLVAEDQQE